MQVYSLWLRKEFRTNCMFRARWRGSNGGKGSGHELPHAAYTQRVQNAETKNRINGFESNNYFFCNSNTLWI